MSIRAPAQTRSPLSLTCAAVIFSALALSCTTDEPTQTGAITALQIRVVFDPRWLLTQLEFRSGDKVGRFPPTERLLASGESVRIVLSDPAAGKPMTILVWGLSGGERVASATVDAVPVVGRTTEMVATLEHLPCGAWCAVGATGCSGDQVRVCQRRETDSCLEWGAPTPCPASLPFCSNGQCAATCVDECTHDVTRCAGPTATQRCGQADSDPCRDWLPEEPCAEKMHCERGGCRDPGVDCVDECLANQTYCEMEGMVTCGQYDTDDCREWGPPAPCLPGQVCTSDRCAEGAGGAAPGSGGGAGSGGSAGAGASAGEAGAGGAVATGGTAGASGVGGSGGTPGTGGAACTPCNPVTQCGCGPHQACDSVGEEPFCRDLSGDHQQNETCTGLDDCAAGLSCVPFDWGGVQTVCVQWCQRDSDCVAGSRYCRIESGVYDLCGTRCDPVTADGCPGGWNCALRGSSMSSLYTLCVPAGIGTEYDACSNDWECAPGYWCIEVIAEGRQCVKVCDAGYPCQCTSFDPLIVIDGETYGGCS